MRPADETTPHPAIIERKGWRARHSVTFAESRPVVSTNGLRYSCFGARVILRPFFSVIAPGAGHSRGILVCTSQNERVDVGECGDFRLGVSVRERGVADASAIHRAPVRQPEPLAARSRGGLSP